MNAKTILNRFLSTTLAVALLFSLSPLAATATEPETADAATGTDASTAPIVSANTPDETVAETPSESPEPQYSEDDYTYMYLVTKKKYTINYQEWIKNGYKTRKCYDVHTYNYDETGLVIHADRTSDSPSIGNYKQGVANYEYDKKGRLVSVKGPYYDFAYSYDKKNRIKKYRMSSDAEVMSYDPLGSFNHKLKYSKRSRSIYNPACRGASLLSSGDKYFFGKKGKVKKVYWFKKTSSGQSWRRKEYYSYNKKNDIVKVRSIDQRSKDGIGSYTYSYKLTYKNGRLVKRKKIDPSANDEAATTKYAYKKFKVLKKYINNVKKQQWRIVNFEDSHDFGIAQPWEY